MLYIKQKEKNMKVIIAAIVLAATVMAPVRVLSSEDSKKPAEFQLTYNKHAKVVFQKNCSMCHNGSDNGLPNWMDYQTVFSKRSLVYQKLTEKQMPPSSVGPYGMNEHERQILVKWIDQGAKE